jgi:tellurite resistance protein TehA-like permease
MCTYVLTVLYRWFAINMGTGIVSILLFNLPWNGYWLHVISYIFFALNVLLFVIFCIISFLRYTLYPEIWPAMISHPAQSLFLGCFPMGFASKLHLSLTSPPLFLFPIISQIYLLSFLLPTISHHTSSYTSSPLHLHHHNKQLIRSPPAIINMMIFACSHWGPGLIYLAWAFWWLDAIISMATCISMPFIVMHRHRPGLDKTTATLLLPIVPAVVAAATGGIVADALPSPGHAYATLVVSYALWGIGQALSGCVLALYFHRLTIHSLPPRDVIVSVFLPIGPLGQGGFGIQQLGKVALKVVPQTAMFRVSGVDAARGAEFLYFLGVFFGIVMWGFALAWVCFALISLRTTRSFPFNMGWWGFTFPLGVWATCSNALWQNLSSEFFKYVTTVSLFTMICLNFFGRATFLTPFPPPQRSSVSRSSFSGSSSA